MWRALVLVGLFTLASCRKADNGKIFEYATSGDSVALKAEIKKGINREALNAVMKQQNVTPLHMAAMEGHTEAVGVLLDAGLPPDLETESGQTALMIAAQAGKVDTVRYLISRGASPTKEVMLNGTIMTPLSFAATEKNNEAVKVLVRYADPSELLPR